MDAIDLKSAISFIKQHNPAQVYVDIKGWVRIKRDLKALHRMHPMGYLETPVEDRWLWRARRAQEKLTQQIRVMGVPVVRVTMPEK